MFEKKKPPGPHGDLNSGCLFWFTIELACSAYCQMLLCDKAQNAQPNMNNKTKTILCMEVHSLCSHWQHQYQAAHSMFGLFAKKTNKTGIPLE